MAEAIIRGASSAEIEGVNVVVRDALEASADDVLDADAYIFGTPENFGYMSGAFKYFLDRIYYDCIGQVAGRPYALFVKAGDDGSGAIASVTRILGGLAVRQVQEPLLVSGELEQSQLSECEQLGMTLAAGLEAGIY